MRTLLLVISIHHQNTLKVAEAIGDVLDAEIILPKNLNPEEIQKYDLIGFGSGIYSGQHHTSLLKLADILPRAEDQKAFLFSTSAMTGDRKRREDHKEMRERLESNDYVIIDEFQCKGFNTNSFMRFFGGMNKGRPNAEDLRHAAEFAESLVRRMKKDSD